MKTDSAQGLSAFENSKYLGWKIQKQSDVLEEIQAQQAAYRALGRKIVAHYGKPGNPNAEGMDGEDSDQRFIVDAAGRYKLDSARRVYRREDVRTRRHTPGAGYRCRKPDRSTPWLWRLVFPEGPATWSEPGAVL